MSFLHNQVSDNWTLLDYIIKPFDIYKYHQLTAESDTTFIFLQRRVCTDFLFLNKVYFLYL